MGAQKGLTLNRSKRLLCIPLDADESESILPQKIPISREGLTLLVCRMKRVKKIKDILLTIYLI